MSSDDVVSLNVGGVEYWSSRQTLLLIPNTYLASLASSSIPITLDPHGRIFIDRDGNLFRHVLNYLRNGGRLTFTEEPTLIFLQALLVEADFYSLTPLKTDLERLIFAEPLRREERILRDVTAAFDSQRSDNTTTLAPPFKSETTFRILDTPPRSSRIRPAAGGDELTVFFRSPNF